MGKLDGKVVFITGAARGQGRSHAQILAVEGAAIVGVDICRQLDSVSYKMPGPEELAETVDLVRESGGRMIGLEVDVRDADGLASAVDKGVEEFGRLDIVLANAGIMAHELPPYAGTRQSWTDSIDVMLTGVWNTLQATIPVLRRQGEGGAVVITSSSAGTRPGATDFDGGHDGYVAAKFGVVGLMRTYAVALGDEGIRVNTVHPTGVRTPMVMNDFFGEYMRAHPKIAASSQNRLPVQVVEPSDISRAILFLVSDDGRYVTGSEYRVDAGVCI
ncbi:MAG TPA: mycofactocin-coupled SDR family oxidoreductase [Jatrophihabitantaceae bacterium]